MRDFIDWVPDCEGCTKGTLAIVSDYPDSEQPVIHRSWWRISNGWRRDECEAWIGQEVQRVSPGRYTWYGGMSPTTFRLERGGETIAFKNEQIPVPKPKTRVETRWNWGRWEKYLKNKGWVPA